MVGLDPPPRHKLCMSWRNHRLRVVAVGRDRRQRRSFHPDFDSVPIVSPRPPPSLGRPSRLSRATIGRGRPWPGGVEPRPDTDARSPSSRARCPADSDQLVAGSAISVALVLSPAPPSFFLLQPRARPPVLSVVAVEDADRSDPPEGSQLLMAVEQASFIQLPSPPAHFEDGHDQQRDGTRRLGPDSARGPHAAEFPRTTRPVERPRLRAEQRPSAKARLDHRTCYVSCGSCVAQIGAVEEEVADGSVAARRVQECVAGGARRSERPASDRRCTRGGAGPAPVSAV